MASHLLPALAAQTVKGSGDLEKRTGEKAPAGHGGGILPASSDWSVARWSALHRWTAALGFGNRRQRASFGQFAPTIVRHCESTDITTAESAAVSMLIRYLLPQDKELQLCPVAVQFQMK